MSNNEPIASAPADVAAETANPRPPSAGKMSRPSSGKRHSRAAVFPMEEPAAGILLV